MRCVLTVNYSPWSRYSGGGQRSTHNLARALAQRGHSVCVIYTKPPWERVPLPAALPYEVLWATLPALRSGPRAWLRPFSALSVARQAQRALGDAADGVVHGHGEEAALVRRHPQRRFGFVMTPRYPWLPNAPLASGTCTVFKLFERLEHCTAMSRGKRVSSRPSRQEHRGVPRSTEPTDRPELCLGEWAVMTSSGESRRRAPVQVRRTLQQVEVTTAR